MDLKTFFGPSSVALVGATENLDRFAGRVLKRMMDFGYAGDVLPVNPRFDAVRGLKCYPTVRDLPKAPDHVGIVVPADKVLGILEDCAARSVPFATIYTGGFAETGTSEGRKRQADILALTRHSGMRIMGPNCNGLISFVDGFAMTTSATIAGSRKCAGNVGVVSQSGGAGQTNIMWRAQDLGLGISYQVSCGNSADLNITDFMEFMVNDPATDVIMVLAEHIPDGRRLFEVAALAAEREKPIVMIKLGRTDAGSRAAASHTGALAGADSVCDAALRQCGIIRVDDCNELYEFAMLLRTRRWPRGTRAGATTISGGNAVLLVDLAASLGISWPEFHKEIREQLTDVLPKMATAGNPVDVTNAAIGKPEIFQRCIELIAADDQIDVVIPVFTMSPAGDIRQAAECARAATKPVPLLWIGGCTDEPGFNAKQVIETGVPVYRNSLSCLKAVRAAMNYVEFIGKRKRTADLVRPNDVDVALPRRLLQSSNGTLTERESKILLSAYGFQALKESLAREPEEAVQIAREIGKPVALKIESADVPHKTEAGAICLHVIGDDAVQESFDRVIAAARRYRPNAKLDGVLVQEMATAGLEVMLGITVDRTFGPVVVAGLGGIHVEVLKDVAYRVAPIDVDEAKAMLRELRGYPLFEGVRGAPRRDIQTLCDLIARLSWLAYDHQEDLVELDINPLVLFEAGAGARVVDALAIGRKEIE